MSETTETGYSIVGRAGSDPAEQLRVVDWHLRRIAEAHSRAEPQLALIDAEIERLQLLRADIARRRDSDCEFHETAIKLWVADTNARETLGKSIALPHGAIRTRQTPGRTEVDSDAVLRLYERDRELYADVVQLSANRSAARRRFKLQGGRVVDTITGEVLTDPVIREVEPPSPSVSVTIEATSAGVEVPDEAD